jgi:hypothetical protein
VQPFLSFRSFSNKSLTPKQGGNYF